MNIWIISSIVAFYANLIAQLLLELWQTPAPMRDESLRAAKGKSQGVLNKPFRFFTKSVLDPSLLSFSCHDADYEIRTRR
jgi:hypothetical protein